MWARARARVDLKEKKFFGGGQRERERRTCMRVRTRVETLDPSQIITKGLLRYGRLVIFLLCYFSALFCLSPCHNMLSFFCAHQ